MVTYQNHWFFWCTLGSPCSAKIPSINPLTLQPKLSIISITSLWIHLPQNESRPFFAQHLIIKELFTDNLRISGLFFPNPLGWSQSQASLCQKSGVKIYPHQNIPPIPHRSNPFVRLDRRGAQCPRSQNQHKANGQCRTAPSKPQPAPEVTNTRETAQTETQQAVQPSLAWAAGHKYSRNRTNRNTADLMVSPFAAMCSCTFRSLVVA